MFWGWDGLVGVVGKGQRGLRRGCEGCSMGLARVFREVGGKVVVHVRSRCGLPVARNRCPGVGESSGGVGKGQMGVGWSIRAVSKMVCS